MCWICGSRLAPEQAATVLMLVGMLDAMTLQLLSTLCGGSHYYSWGR